MNFVVPLGTIRNIKSVGVETNSFYDLARYKVFTCQGLITPSLHLKVSSVNLDPIIDVEGSGFLHTKGASSVVDALEDVVDVVVHYSHSVEPFFCGRRAEFIVVI